MVQYFEPYWQRQNPSRKRPWDFSTWLAFSSRPDTLVKFLCIYFLKFEIKNFPKRERSVCHIARMCKDCRFSKSIYWRTLFDPFFDRIYLLWPTLVSRYIFLYLNKNDTKSPWFWKKALLLASSHLNFNQEKKIATKFISGNNGTCTCNFSR